MMSACHLIPVPNRGQHRAHMTPTTSLRFRVLALVLLFVLPLGVWCQPAGPTYDETFRDLHRVLGERYGAFALKPEIDWRAIGEELIPRAAAATSDDEFGLVCLELVARLEDSHAELLPALRDVPTPPASMRWDSGFVCMEDDRGMPVVYHVDPKSPASRARITPGLTILAIDDEPTSAIIARTEAELRRWTGYSSDRYLRYHAVHFFHRRANKGDLMTILARRPDGMEVGFRVAATRELSYQPRLPVPIAGVSEGNDVSSVMLPGGIGYIYVRRMGEGLEADLDQAAARLVYARALIIDVRGNSGGGFDSETAHANFDCSGAVTPRPVLCVPTAVLIDERCISAGEGWVSWFHNHARIRFFGQTTAGGSSVKDYYRLRNGFYRVRIPVRPRTGFLDRPIERRGIEPDEFVRQTAADLAAGRDTVLEAAKDWLNAQ